MARKVKKKSKVFTTRYRVSWYVQVEGVAAPDKGTLDHFYYRDARKHYKNLCYQHFASPKVAILHLRLVRIGKGYLSSSAWAMLHEYSLGELPPEEQTINSPDRNELLKMSFNLNPVSIQ